MKVLLIADLLIRNHDGCNRTLFHIIDRLERYDIDLKIICGEQTDLPSKYEILQVPSITLPFNKDYKAALPYPQGQKIEKMIKDFEPDIIHITSPSLLGLYVQKIALKYQIKTTTIYHTNFLSYFDYYLQSNNSLARNAKKMVGNIYKKFYTKFDVVFSPTNLMKSHLLNLGLSPNNIKIWGRGIDRDLFNNNTIVKNLNQKLFNNSDPIVLFASRLVWEKNLGTLIKVYEQVTDQNLKYNFLIIGDGKSREELSKAMPKAIFLKNISQKELSVYYASSDVFLFPSDTETYGNVLIEAMSCGLPIIAANGGSNAELVRNFEDGLIVPSHDHEAYTSALSTILANRAYYSQNNLHNPKLYTWTDLVDQLIHQLEKIATQDKKVAI